MNCTQRQKQILKILKENPGINAVQIAKIDGSTFANIQHLLLRMINNGIINAKRSKYGSHYEYDTIVIKDFEEELNAILND